VLSINIPMTFPPLPVNGAVVSGVFLPPDATFTHPPELQQELADLGGFPINGLEWADVNDLADLFEEARVMVRQRALIAERLLEREHWDVALVGFMAPDRLQHAAMHLLDPEYPSADRNRHSQDLVRALHAVYGELDASLGRLMDKASPDTFILASDHGFRSVWLTLVPNRLLEELGTLAYREGRSRLRLMTHPLRRRLGRTWLASRARRTFGVEATIDWSKTVAYNPSAPCQGIRLNIHGREPHGIVPPSKAELLVEELIQQLQGWCLPSGDPAFSIVARAEDVMGKPATEPGVPDIYFELGEGVAVSGEGPKTIQSSGRRTGEHRAEGIIVAIGETDPRPEAIWEVPHRILRSVGIDGWPRRQPVDSPRRDVLTPQEESAVEEHLRGLGYVE